MARVQIALVAAGIMGLSAVNADDRPGPGAVDSVAAELRKAKEEYLSIVETAGEKLLAAFADQQKKLQESTKLKVDQRIKLIDQLQGEKKAFESDQSNLPRSPGMKIAVSDYQTRVGAAKKRCEAAFDRAAEAYGGKKDLASAKAVLAEKERFLKGSLAQVPVGIWGLRYDVDVKAETVIKADGTAVHSDSIGRRETGSVKADGNSFVIRYQTFVEVWRVSPDGRKCDVAHFHPKSRYPDAGANYSATATRK